MQRNHSLPVSKLVWEFLDLPPDILLLFAESNAGKTLSWNCDSLVVVPLMSSQECCLSKATKSAPCRIQRLVPKNDRQRATLSRLLRWVPILARFWPRLRQAKALTWRWWVMIIRILIKGGLSVWSCGRNSDDNNNWFPYFWKNGRAERDRHEKPCHGCRS